MLSLPHPLFLSRIIDYRVLIFCTINVLCAIPCRSAIFVNRFQPFIYYHGGAMKLYFSPGACSLSPHIVLREAGLHFDLDQVDLSTKKTIEGKDYTAINPDGYVPALQLDDGHILTEGPAIVQYIADLVPAKQLVPAAGSIERYQLMGTLNFISTELHKTFSPLFASGTPEETRRSALDALAKRVGTLSAKLGKSEFICGNHFTVADAYLFTVLSWSRYVNFDLAPWPSIVSYLERIGARPNVHAALVAEGLVKG
jgi:glutathione S-transferase